MSNRGSFETEKNVKRRKAREAFRQVANKPAVVSGNKVMNNINMVNAILNEKVRLKGEEKGNRSNYNKYNIRDNANSSRVRDRDPYPWRLFGPRKINVFPSRVKPLATRPALPNNVQNLILKKKEALEYVNELINAEEKNVVGHSFIPPKQVATQQLRTAIGSRSLVPIRKMRAGMGRQKNFKNTLAAFLTNDSVKMPHEQKLRIVKKLINQLYVYGGLGVRPKDPAEVRVYNQPSNAGRYLNSYRMIMQALNLLKKPSDLDDVRQFWEMTTTVNKTKNNLPNEFYPKFQQVRPFLGMPANKRRHILNVMKNIKNKNGAAREDAMIEYQKHFLKRGDMVSLLKQRKRAVLNREIRNYKKEHGKKRKLPERFANERSKIARIDNLPTSTLKNMMNTLKHNP
jgi:hypothetical protein